jgi:hypothetical protein
MSEPTLLLHEPDARGVITLTLNRPQAFNALSEGLLEALQTALDRASANESAHARHRCVRHRQLEQGIAAAYADAQQTMAT